MPALEFKQRGVVATQSLRHRLSGNGRIEHATKGWTIYRDGLNGKTENPPGKDIHHDQHPITLQEKGFRAKNVPTPERVLRVGEQRKPGRSIVSIFRPVVPCQRAEDDVPAQRDSEALGQLLGDLATAQARVASFEFDDRLDQILSGPFRAGFVPLTGGIKPFEFELCECLMTAQQGEGLYENSRAKEPAQTQEQRAQPEEEAIGEAQVGGASAESTQDWKWMFQKKILGDERLGSVRLREFAQASRHVKDD